MPDRPTILSVAGTSISVTRRTGSYSAKRPVPAQIRGRVSRVPPSERKDYELEGYDPSAGDTVAQFFRNRARDVERLGQGRLSFLTSVVVIIPSMIFLALLDFFDPLSGAGNIAARVLVQAELVATLALPGLSLLAVDI